MNKVIGLGKGLLKVAFLAVVVLVNCVLNFVGAIVCVISGN